VIFLHLGLPHYMTRLIYIYIQSGWWFGTFFIFPYIVNNHHPNWLIFFRGVGLNHQPVMVQNRWCHSRTKQCWLIDCVAQKGIQLPRWCPPNWSWHHLEFLEYMYSHTA
jgi:hypothetical protein